MPTDPRTIKLRYAGNCKECGADLPKGSEAWHFTDERKVACLECHSSTGGARLKQAEPGASARREYRRRTTSRQKELQDRWGTKIGKVAWLLEDEKQTTSAWAKGAKGEHKIGEFLEKKLADRDCELLHDRSIPGSRANIDHIVIGPAGVTVIDAKFIDGKVRSATAGIGKRRRRLLTVDGRDRTNLIESVRHQVAAVESVLEELQPPIEVPVRGIICWWKVEGLPFPGVNRIAIDGVRVLNPRTSAQVAGDEGGLSTAAISVVADLLDLRLRPA